MKAWWKRTRRKLFSGVAKPVISALMGTTKIEFLHRERWDDLETSSIICGLHANGLIAGWAFRGLGLWTMVSQSKDGELQNRIYTKLGFKTVRGSSGSSGVRATLEAIKLLRGSKETLIVATDGSRGPRGVVQQGAILMAKKSGCALMATGYSSNRRWQAKSWDLFHIPKPFSRICIAFAEPIYVPVDANDEQMEEIRVRLEETILAIEAEADAMTGYVPKPGEKRQ